MYCKVPYFSFNKWSRKCLKQQHDIFAHIKNNNKIKIGTCDTQICFKPWQLKNVFHLPEYRTTLPKGPFLSTAARMLRRERESELPASSSLESSSHTHVRGSIFFSHIPPASLLPLCALCHQLRSGEGGGIMGEGRGG